VDRIHADARLGLTRTSAGSKNATAAPTSEAAVRADLVCVVPEDASEGVAGTPPE
jgi:hypothetical protein